MLTADLASRHEGITSLMLLSGPPSDAAIAHIAATPGLAEFGRPRPSGDTITPGVADVISRAVDGSGHEKSMAKVYDGTEHGLPMFEANSDLQPLLIAWLKNELLSELEARARTGVDSFAPRGSGAPRGSRRFLRLQIGALRLPPAG